MKDRKSMRVPQEDAKFNGEMNQALQIIKARRDEGLKAFDVMSTERVFKCLQAWAPNNVFPGIIDAVETAPHYSFVVALSREAYDLHE